VFFPITPYIIYLTGEAENIIKFETDLLELPMALPTLSTIDMARQAQQDQLKLHSSQPPLYY